MKTKRSQQKVRKPKVYTAGPLGFSEVGRLFHESKMIPCLESLGYLVLDPWKLTPESEIGPVISLPFGKRQADAWRKLNPVIGKNNAVAIQQCDIVVAVLDGVDVDSGTAAEIGYAAALGKRIEGYRGDFRLSCDNIGGTVNLQVEYFIREMGKGSIVSTLSQLERRMKDFVVEFHK
jgi:nucleoside 2-deoxyribosyltransferase